MRVEPLLPALGRVSCLRVWMGVGISPDQILMSRVQTGFQKAQNSGWLSWSSLEVPGFVSSNHIPTKKASNLELTTGFEDVGGRKKSGMPGKKNLSRADITTCNNVAKSLFGWFRSGMNYHQECTARSAIYWCSGPGPSLANLHGGGRAPQIPQNHPFL